MTLELTTITYNKENQRSEKNPSQEEERKKTLHQEGQKYSKPLLTNNKSRVLEPNRERERVI